MKPLPSAPNPDSDSDPTISPLNPPSNQPLLLSGNQLDEAPLPPPEPIHTNSDNNDVNDRRLSSEENHPPIFDKKSSLAVPNRKGTISNKSESPNNKGDGEIDVFKVSEVIRSKRIIALENLIEGKGFQTVVTLFTLYALFAADLKYLISTKDSDDIWDSFTIFSLCIFSFEICCSIFYKKNYLLSFFFWLDVLSTITLIFDLSSVDSGLFGGSGAGQLTRASRATKIGSRAGRVVRLIRLIRIVKIWKSIKTNQEKKNQISNSSPRLSSHKIDKKKISPNLRILEHEENRSSIQSSSQNSPIYSRISNPSPFVQQPSQFNLKIHPIIDSNLPPSSPDALLDPPLTPQKGPKNSFAMNNKDTIVAGPPLEVTEEDEEVPEDKESRVGKRLSELTTKRVVILVLVLIFCVPLFQSNYYFDPDPGVSMGIQMIYDMSVQRVSLVTIESTVKDYINMNKANFPLIYLNVPSIPGMIYKSMEPSELRTDEKVEVVLTSDLFEGDFYAVADSREKAKKNAILGITRTIFVSLVLSLGAMFFSKDANDLALRPIERMIEKVNRIARNPLASKEEIVSSGSGYETTIIENAIIKIGALLALGFGDAGSEIIASNMAKGGDVDPMMAGKRKCAVFGFCDIRSFTDATEVLQEEVMVFVNSIAQIVHKTVDKYAGAANKNIGDAFLLVYKFPEDTVTALPGGVLELKRCRTTKNIADMSLISFLKIIAGINRKPAVLKYRTNEKLCLRMPGYKVKMGFGLHFGWAIEGAIGSEFKIDASYLSPNVNMASRLEAATKQYGVPLLISNELHNILSKKTQRVCREIDRVTVKGSKKPIGLYTVDTDLSQMERALDKGYTKAELKAKHKEKKQLIKENTVSNANNAELIKANGFFDTDKDLLLLCHQALGPFRNTFSDAFEQYIRGDWTFAKETLENGLKEREDDGPSQTLLSVMKEFGGRAPDDWKGFRVLTDK